MGRKKTDLKKHSYVEIYCTLIIETYDNKLYI